MLTKKTINQMSKFLDECIREADEVGVDRNDYCQHAAEIFYQLTQMTDVTHYKVE